MKHTSIRACAHLNPTTATWLKIDSSLPTYSEMVDKGWIMNVYKTLLSLKIWCHNHDLREALRVVVVGLHQPAVQLMCLSWAQARSESPWLHIVHCQNICCVSKNRGYPQIIHFDRVFHYKPSILGYPYFWKHPFAVFSKTSVSCSQMKVLQAFQPWLHFVLAAGKDHSPSFNGYIIDELRYCLLQVKFENLIWNTNFLPFFWF